MVRKICMALVLALLVLTMPSLAEIAQFEFVTVEEEPQNPVESRIDAWIDENDLQDYISEDVRQALITIITAVENGAQSAGNAVAQAWAVVLEWAVQAPTQAKQAVENLLASPEVVQFINDISQIGGELSEEFSRLWTEFGDAFDAFLNIAGDALSNVGDAVGEFLSGIFS